ncbi:hypothetical protein [Mycolicibacterium litorale]|uniref:hypothetical protein n=1 Tax=Mycolicibacterium litorale TaxID=758802 RepID=UPI00162A7BDE|nr:hypothetical protein [Mycolicibacterium litorale]
MRPPRRLPFLPVSSTRRAVRQRLHPPVRPQVWFNRLPVRRPLLRLRLRPLCPPGSLSLPPVWPLQLRPRRRPGWLSRRRV